MSSPEELSDLLGALDDAYESLCDLGGAWEREAVRRAAEEIRLLVEKQASLLKMATMIQDDLERTHAILVKYMRGVGNAEGVYFTEPSDWPDIEDRMIVLTALHQAGAQPAWLAKWMFDDVS